MKIVRIQSAEGEVVTPLTAAESVYIGDKKLSDTLQESTDRTYIEKLSLGPDKTSGIKYNPITKGYDFIC